MTPMNDEEVLDEAEQNKIIEDLTSQAAQLSSSTRKFFMWLFIFISGCFFFCIVHSSNNPWSMEHQRHFREVVPHSLFLTYYAASSFCFAIAAVVVQVSRHLMFLFPYLDFSYHFSFVGSPPNTSHHSVSVPCHPCVSGCLAGVGKYLLCSWSEQSITVLDSVS